MGAEGHAGLHEEDHVMKGGVDQGICFDYWRLSYRRKFIRTLWYIPFFVAFMAAAIAFDWRPRWLEPPWEHVAGVVFLAVLFPAKLYYTHRKWRQEQERDG